MSHNARHTRYEKLREAGFSPEQAKSLRDSEARTQGALRAVRRGESTVSASKKFQESPLDEVKERLAVSSPTAERLRNQGQDDKDTNWARWSGDKFPSTILRVAEAFRNALIRQGRDRGEINDKLFGLVWQWYQGEFEYDDLVSDTDIFDEY